MADLDFSAEDVRNSFLYIPETGALFRRRSGGLGPLLAKSNGYIVASFGDKNYQAHRLIWLISYGKWPDGVIDHINGIKTDNRLCNLRDVSQAVNSRNNRRAKKVRHIGPMPRDGQWFAILPNYLSEREVGPFSTHGEAQAAFDAGIKFARMTEGRVKPKLVDL